MNVEIIYEDKDIIAVSKPAGLLVHHTPKGEEELTLADWLLERYPEVAQVGDRPDVRPGMVHRLDKGTSGVVVIARSQEAFKHLKRQFRERLVHKTYHAIVFGNPKHASGVIEGNISLKPGTVKRTVHKGKMAKKAVTEYRVLERFGNAALLEVHPKTGRTHQVRVHLASINHPVLGDTLYASKSSKKLPVPGLVRQMLHAYGLALEVRPGVEREFTANPPEDFLAVLQYLRRTSTLDTQ